MSLGSLLAKMQLDSAFTGDATFELLARDGYVKAAKSLTAENLNECALGAVLSGNLDLLTFLHEQRGPLQVNLASKASGFDQITLNGAAFSGNDNPKLDRIKSRSRLKALVKAISDFGMTGLVEPGDSFPLLFRKLLTVEKVKHETQPVTYPYEVRWPKSAVHALEVERFSGELPYLANGIVSAPELAMALKHEESVNPHGEAYRPILCWASPAMVDEFPDSLAPLTPFQTMSDSDDLTPLPDWADGTWRSDYGRLHLTSGVRPSPVAQYADLMMDSLSPLSVALGFKDPGGRILCETTTDFLLSGFDLAGTTSENTEAAKAFAVGYCPYEIIARQSVSKSIQEFGHDPTAAQDFKNQCSATIDAASNALFSLFQQESPLRDSAFGMMSRAQWKGLFGQANGRNLHASSLIAMYEAFGFDNTGLVVELKIEDISAYQAAGYRFSHHTRCTSSEFGLLKQLEESPGWGETFVLTEFKDMSYLVRSEESLSGILERVNEVYTPVVIDLDLWPSESLRPRNLAEALQLASSVNFNDWHDGQSMGLRAMLLNAGLEDCVEVAKSPESWVALAELFSRDAMTPYIKQMPRAARGMLVEQDLGM